MKYWDYTKKTDGCSIAFKWTDTCSSIDISTTGTCSIREDCETQVLLEYSKQEMIEALKEVIALIENNGEL